ncbi:MAG: CDP-alcohol phosphatidyltransferase family protein [Spirochaetia bacterium]|nr:CDP-alcohol phosphatidyltransferase family protein [Spirochaetia bacterium]
MFKSWIPNALSLGNLTFGFLSILIISHAKTTTRFQAEDFFFLGSILILIAALFDGLDGPIARKLSAESALGEQLDSLADLTTFGLAPAFLMYHAYFASLNTTISGYEMPFGMILSAIYPICAAYRLARFNVAHDKKSFIGLPSPIAGIFSALIPIICAKYNFPLYLLAFSYAATAFLMVSNIRYAKPTADILSKITIFRLITFILLVVALILTLEWFWIIFLVMILYIFSGIITLFMILIQKIKIGAGYS